MARYSLSLPTDFEVPALLSVSGLLVAISLTKGGYALWAIGGMVFLYGLYLTARCVTLGASSSSARSTTVADTTIEVRPFIACATTAAMLVAASTVTAGIPLAHSDLDQPIEAPTKSADRPIGISLRQIEYCLGREVKNGQTALNPTLVDREHKCPIDQLGI